MCVVSAILELIVLSIPSGICEGNVERMPMDDDYRLFKLLPLMHLDALLPGAVSRATGGRIVD